MFCEEKRKYNNLRNQNYFLIPPLRTLFHNSKHFLHLGTKFCIFPERFKQTIQSKIGSCQIVFAHYVKRILANLDLPKYAFFEMKLHVVVSFPMFCDLYYTSDTELNVT